RVLIVSLPLKMVLKERQLDLLAEELTGFGMEAHVAEPVAVAAGPAAVDPGAHDETVAASRYASRLDALERVQRSEEGLRVEPAPDGHHRRLDLLDVLSDVARLPELVVVRVSHDLVPEGHLTLEELRVVVGERSEFEEEPVAVRRSGIEGEIGR